MLFAASLLFAANASATTLWVSFALGAFGPTRGEYFSILVLQLFGIYVLAAIIIGLLPAVVFARAISTKPESRRIVSGPIVGAVFGSLPVLFLMLMDLNASMGTYAEQRFLDNTYVIGLFALSGAIGGLVFCIVYRKLLEFRI